MTQSTPPSSINYGVKTGLNEAFIVDDRARSALIREDPRSAEVLKPLVRGRDVGAYSVAWAGLWLVATHNGYGRVPRVDVSRYPAVERHLHRFMPALKQRQDRGDTPYNLRSCAYHAEFEKPKLLWNELAKYGRFALDREGHYCNNTVFFLAGPHLTWLCAVLNSFVARKWMSWTARTSGMGTTRWEKGYVEGIPVPVPSSDRLGAVETLIQRIAQGPDRTGGAGRPLPTSREELGERVRESYHLSVEDWELLS